MMLVQSQAYREQYGFNSILLFPVNLYGPRDNFDLETLSRHPSLNTQVCDRKRSRPGQTHVVGKRISDSRVSCMWRTPRKGILLAAEHYEGSLPVNLGTGEEVTIRNLAAMIAAEAGFAGQIDMGHQQAERAASTVPGCQPCQRTLGFHAKHALREGLKKTMQWFFANRNALREVQF